MLSALASGTLARDTKSGISASGVRWANASIRCATGTDKEGNATTSFINVLAFHDDADRLAKLAKGDAVSVQGSLKETQYTAKDGTVRAGLEILVNGILSVHDKRKKANGSDQPARPSQQRQQSHYADFDDRPGF